MHRFVLTALLAAFAAFCTLSVSWSRSTDPTLQPASPNLPLGASVYAARCGMCHGTDGKGDGPDAPLVTPRPRDFTSGKYKFRSTSPGSIPSDADLARTIQDGLPGTSMPGMREFVGGDTLRALIGYIKSFSPRFTAERPAAVRSSATAAAPGSPGAGKKVYDKLQCYGCHGSDGTGADAIATGLTDDWQNPVAATNLTEPWTFRGGAGTEDIYYRLVAGIDGTPMPSFRGSASDRELTDLAAYVRSLGRTPVWSMKAGEVGSFYDSLEKKEMNDPVEHGRYLVESHGCIDCHTPRAADGSMLESLKLAGGMTFTLGPYGTVVSTNLTPDKETGIGGWTDDELKKAIMTGVRRDGSRSIPFPMPWTSYASFRNSDVTAIIAYLRSLPPVQNAIPAPKSLNVFSYLWAKFKMLILKQDFAVTSPPGNAGSARTSDTPQQANGGTR
ncbi:MAG TPA: cytochrome c [Bacteroidota bacterium]|nr:cytochrome c [Bacteroidota bacterium]